MHRLLKRQIKHTYGKEFDINTLDGKVRELLSRIEENYLEVDLEKRFLNHTININSEELNEAYKTIAKHNISLKEEVNEKELYLQQYKDAIDTTFIVSKMDHDYKITYANQQFYDISKYKKEELLQKEHIILHEKYMNKKMHKKMRQALEKKEIWKGRLETLNRNKESYHVDVTVLPLFNPYGEILEYMIIEHDISQLEHARELAVASIEAKSQFMANMSHEIRTPMNGIMGFTSLLKQTTLNTKQMKYLSLTEESMHSLLRITNDILDFSKIEAGHLQLDVTEVNPFIDIKKAISIFSSKCRDKNISFQVYIDSNINECIIIDKLRVTQVLNNLINNAIKFTPEDGVIQVELKNIETSDERAKILFSVGDTGIGIATERLDSIFKSFIQADSSTTRKFGGTGLGLTISQSLCELMSSELKVESQIDEGSKFFFELEVETCESNKKLATQIKNNLIYVCENDKKVYSGVLQQLKNFSLSYKTISFEKLILEEEIKDIIIIFNHKLYRSLSKLGKNIILIDETPEAVNIGINKNVHHIDSYGECPSELYNVMQELSFTSERIETRDISEEEQFDLSILVAEDYEINRILIDEMLRVYGIKPDFAVNGLEAVDMVTKKAYDVIFMDINMPELNGIEATKIIRDQNNITPIVALTANALEGDKEYYLTQGMNNYISKPIDADILLEVLSLYNSTTEQINTTTDTVNDEGLDNIVAGIMKAKEKMHFNIKIMKKLFESFIDGSYESINQIVAAANENNIKVIKVQAHAIRGGSLSLNFDSISKLCHTLEYNDDIDYTTLSQTLSKEITSMYRQKEKILTILDELE